MKVVFFTSYYPPDLSAGSFRAVALVKALSKKISANDRIHVITTHPNRYASYRLSVEDEEVQGNITISRIKVPNYKNGMILQGFAYCIFFWRAVRYCLRIKPDFIIGTTGRLMTGVLTWLSSIMARCFYFIDLRDIFSETISDLFSRKSPILGKLLRIFFLAIEKRIFLNATSVNVVSEGFPEYFSLEDIDTSKWTFFPNGVDMEFTGKDFQFTDEQSSQKIILYAGNIGSGQGLETIIPDVASYAGNSFNFQIVGDGGTRSLLEKKIEVLGVENVELLFPMSRKELIKYYQKADILFMHLNNFAAFKRVLPSKIFEYAAIGKPIVAGLSGYSAKFIVENIEQAFIFEPGDINACLNCIEKAKTFFVNQSNVQFFVKNFSREKIMDKMADHILQESRQFLM